LHKDSYGEGFESTRVIDISESGIGEFWTVDASYRFFKRKVVRGMKEGLR
jgi:hypothetical protein